MNIGFVYEPFDARAGSFGAHGHFLARELVRRGHMLIGPGLRDAPGMVTLPNNKWGKLQTLWRCDLLYIRISNLHWLERTTWLRLLRPRCPVVWEVNGTSEELLGGSNPNSVNIQRFRKDVRRKRRMAFLVDAAVCVGQELADYVQRRYGVSRTIAVPNGGDLDAWRPEGGGTFLSTLSNRFRVIWAGDAGIVWQGIDLILDAAKRCESLCPDVLFVLVLGGKNPRESLPMRKNVVYLKGGDRVTVRSYIADADCVLAVYQPVPWRALSRGYPMKTLEAMAACKPVIVDEQSAYAVADGVHGLISQQHGDAMAVAINRLRKDPSLREQLAANARRRVETELNWASVVDRIEPLLFELTGKAQPTHPTPATSSA